MEDLKKLIWLYNPQIKISRKMDMFHLPFCKLAYFWTGNEQKQTKLQVDSDKA